jgi:hypothetical protein
MTEKIKKFRPKKPEDLMKLKIDEVVELEGVEFEFYEDRPKKKLRIGMFEV